jgi:hypothetical protein
MAHLDHFSHMFPVTTSFLAVLLAAAAVPGTWVRGTSLIAKMAHYIQLTLLSALPHVAAASLMSIKMFG